MTKKEIQTGILDLQIIKKELEDSLVFTNRMIKILEKQIGVPIKKILKDSYRINRVPDEQIMEELNEAMKNIGVPIKKSVKKK
jgi:cellulose biosynthesis protein BcsQ